MNNIKKKKALKILAAVLVVLVFLYMQNNLVGITNIKLNNEKIPKAFNRFKIVQLSDLHNKMFWNSQKSLANKIKKINPDIIVITGDLVDSKKYNEENSLKLIDEIKAIAPIYYVNGNHENWSGKYESLEKKLLEREVKVLRNQKEMLVRQGESIELLGVDDPSFIDNNDLVSINGMAENIKRLIEEDNFPGLKILLSHRPEYFEEYVKQNIDVILSGHAHGGQFRLPLLGGLIAPNQGFFPKYTSGKYLKNDSVMIVSRGLGNSIIPIRLFNRPEIVVITLSK